MAEKQRKTPGIVWWGEWMLPPEKRGLWQIGPLDLWLTHAPGELILLANEMREPLDTSLRIQVPARKALPAEAATRLRFAGAGLGGHITLTPALADRPFVSRPEQPLHIPPREGITLYIGSPLWVQVRSGGEGGSLLHELPSYRPSDTWFGGNTREGEMAYASRTHARLDWRDLPRTPHRAVTPVHIHNAAEDILYLERISLPVARLSLYVGEPGGPLWTQPVTLERRERGGLAELRLDAGPPEEAGAEAQPLAAPRISGDKRFVTRAFSALF